jgi:hypothetical protein
MSSGDKYSILTQLDSLLARHKKLMDKEERVLDYLISELGIPETFRATEQLSTSSNFNALVMPLVQRGLAEDEVLERLKQGGFNFGSDRDMFLDRIRMLIGQAKRRKT